MNYLILVPILAMGPPATEEQLALSVFIPGVTHADIVLFCAACQRLCCLFCPSPFPFSPERTSSPFGPLPSLDSLRPPVCPTHPSCPHLYLPKHSACPLRTLSGFLFLLVLCLLFLHKWSLVLWFPSGTTSPSFARWISKGQIDLDCVQPPERKGVWCKAKGLHVIGCNSFVWLMLLSTGVKGRGEKACRDSTRSITLWSPGPFERESQILTRLVLFPVILH